MIEPSFLSSLPQSGLVEVEVRGLQTALSALGVSRGSLSADEERGYDRGVPESLRRLTLGRVKSPDQWVNPGG